MHAILTNIKNLVPARYRPIGYLLHLTRARTECRVRSGPFTGLHYVQDSVGSAYIPKLLGIYESELAQIIEEICRRRPALIVDIGAAEGYYAIGLAARNPEAKIIAFEAEPRGRSALTQMAALNDVSHRVDILGRCEPDILERALASANKPVIVCDVEGYEQKLLDPATVPSLVRACVLVELHDFIIPGITELLKQRFRATHRIHHIWQQSRSRNQFPWRTFGTTLLPNSYLDWSVSEWRPVRMAWLWMEPHG